MTRETIPFLLYGMFIITVILVLICIILTVRERRKIRQQLDSIANAATEISPNEFIKLRNASFGGIGRPHVSNQYDFAGIYILFNKTKGMYYVGQGKSVFKRVNSHFTGKGNGDVYADFKYGDEFTIKMIPLENSGFNTLNELERNAIYRYDAYYKGYNKTRGNKG